VVKITLLKIRTAHLGHPPSQVQMSLSAMSLSQSDF
jgi:hypothetical protein